MTTDDKGQASRSVLPSLTSLLGRYLPLRRRYVLTRNNRLRLRYVASPLVLAALTLSAANGFSSLPNATTSANPGAAVIAARDSGSGSWTGDQAKFFYAFYQKRLERYDTAPNTAPAATPAPVAVAQAAPPKIRERIIHIAKGDTLSSLLKRAGVAADEAYQMVAALKTIYDPRDLKPGQKVSVQFEPQPNSDGDYDTAHVVMPIDTTKSVTLEKKDDGTYKTALVKKPVETRIHAGKVKIETSLYGSAAKAGIPSSVIAELIRVYSYDIDFQRDLRKGDIAEAMYQQVETANGDAVKTGDLLFARLVIDGRSLPIYRYELNGVVDYYTADGKSVRKALMRTPVDGARISSGFGVRVHPVLGFTKMHKGIDFAAPIGTPIYASGNGTVERCGPFSTYGNYVKIRHNNTMETAYAHMSRFADGLRAGSKVHQGQIIGYIGRTGRVTGPHLHYEILVNNSQVNPASVSMAQADTLNGKQLAAFKAHVAKMNQQFATLGGTLKVASRHDDDADTTALR